MSLLDAVIATGQVPLDTATQAQKKRYSEILSAHLAVEVSEGLREVGFLTTKPVRGGPGEKAFQGGLGPKRVDVSYSDEQHGLLLAVSLKTINFAPFGKNLKNRFADFCTEAITLHMRFPYSVICAILALPAAADLDTTSARTLSTFQRAVKLFSTISGRAEHTDPAEKFEHFALMLFQPSTKAKPASILKLIDATTQQPLSEKQYFSLLRDLYNKRNPHALIQDESGNTDDSA